jgi:hypothetical protein
MMQSILDALKARLAATTALTSIVGTRIYLDVGQANAPLPLLTYRVTNVDVEPHNSATRYVVDFEFTFFFGNTGTQDIHSAASALATALSLPLSPTGFDRAKFVLTSAGVPSFSDDAWSMLIQYRAYAFDT